MQNVNGMKKLTIVWVSKKQKDSLYSALAVTITEPVPGIVQKVSGFVRGKKKFVMDAVIEVPKGMTVTLIGDDWVFEAEVSSAVKTAKV